MTRALSPRAPGLTRGLDLRLRHGRNNEVPGQARDASRVTQTQHAPGLTRGLDLHLQHGWHNEVPDQARDVTGGDR